MHHLSDVTIVSPSWLYVQQMQAQNEVPRKQKRVIHHDIDFAEIDPSIKTLSRKIADNRENGQRVHVPAMRCSEWGQVLRALELNRFLS